MMRIVALIKQVPDTWGERRIDSVSGRIERSPRDGVADEIDERAIEFALAHKAVDKSVEVVALTLGPAGAIEVVRRVLSMGADSGVHVLDDGLEGADASLTAEAIARAVARGGFDLIVAGNSSTDGRGGVIPAMLAEHLGVPHLTELDSVELAAGIVRGVRGGDEGDVNVHASLPAVISITERMPDPRLPNFKGIMTAKRKPVDVVSLADLGVTVADRPRSVVASVVARPPRQGGTKIVDDGTASAALAAFLVDNSLV